MQKNRKALAALAPLAIAGVMLASCSADGSDGGSTGADNGGGSAAESTLRVNYGEFPENWSPGQAMEGGPARVVYETLLAPGDDGMPAPNLATDYELTADALTLTLREDVTFHDGEPFDAEAVKANVEFVQAGATQASGQLGSIESVDVVDEFIVRFNLSEPNPSLAHTLTSRALLIASPVSLESGDSATHPVGTSPWAYDPDASVMGTRLMFAGTDDYWGEQPAFDDVELYAIGESEAAAAALRNGEIDVSEVEPDAVAAFEGTDVESIMYPAIRNNIVFFDRGPGGVFESQELRQAFCTAMDVETFANDIADDFEAATQHFDEGEAGYSSDIDGYPADIDAATALYEAAGSPSISFDLIGAVYNAHQLEVFMEMASEIGDVNISVESVPPPQFGSEWNTGRYPLGLGSTDEATPYEWYKAWFAADAPNNPAGVESDELRAAADAAIAAGDSAEAAELWGDVAEIVADEALVCAHARGLETIAWNSTTVSGVDQPAEKWEPQLLNYRDVAPVE
ncbi:ABC transporter substrate-binding protein [Microbacterium karelineae]|uniref:ABC transporter substrate-binding protein n=1 Tax=Microbacterium karelineae TaxID=2654283 RepID=UPI0012E99FF7|nr:ABC transporter substrate-binding protein [Microbacterium karelineae]